MGAPGQDAEHTFQFPAVAPGVSPGAVGNWVADTVMTDCFPIVACQQVAPMGIAVGIGDGIYDCAQGSGGIGILATAQDVAVTVTKIDICLGQFTGHGPKIGAGVCSFFYKE